jgi:ribose 5-phosphate isomerase B
MGDGLRRCRELRWIHETNLGERVVADGEHDDPWSGSDRAMDSDRLVVMRVYLGGDHAGFELKAQISEHLTSGGHEVIDCGAHEYDAVDDYPAFCVEAARRTVADEGSLGIVLGGSGNGEQIAANKVPGARCALAWSVETAQLARQHNNAQLIGIGGRMHSKEEALAIVDAFVTTAWSGEERHQRRIDILAEYERTGTPPALPAD